MRLGFYPKLALTGIMKNKKTYFPYILTSLGMVMMLYIVSFLTYSESVRAMPGGVSVAGFLGLGCFVIGIFSTILLFYTNSFLIRRRKKEFGLYNILGMGKRNLARILIWETLMIAAFSILAGLGCGILFSKNAELVVANILNSDVGFAFEISGAALEMTVCWFAAIFLLILLNALRQIHLAKPIELMHSEAVGEKAPKANWILAFFGVLLLGGAYWLAISIQNPVDAMLWFFVAVIMVILATYLLFIAGSVAFCRILQKKKGYYYKTNHFISISSMVYRMKRNGAGLASICILSTMVLVMISSTSCLYIGREATMRERYPKNMMIEAQKDTETFEEELQQSAKRVLDRYHVTPENEKSYRYLSVGAFMEGSKAIFSRDKVENMNVDYSKIYQCFFLPLSDYNQIMGTDETLASDEAFIYKTRSDEGYAYDSISFENGKTYRVRNLKEKIVGNGIDVASVFSSYFIVLPDMEAVEEIYQIQADIYGENRSEIRSYYGFDLSCDEAVQIEMRDAFYSEFIGAVDAENSGIYVNVECAAAERNDFYALYGGFFCLGIILGIVFICGAVLIMYYKQIIEGYEDQSRFEILQKVGMTKREIKKSINSQILTVFFMPLLLAGLHMAFAFPLIEKMLLLFGVVNTKLLVFVTLGSYGVFAVFYILVYLATSRAYYGIVSGKTSE